MEPDCLWVCFLAYTAVTGWIVFLGGHRSKGPAVVLILLSAFAESGPGDVTPDGVRWIYGLLWVMGLVAVVWTTVAG